VGVVVAARGAGDLGVWRGWNEEMRVAGSGESGGRVKDGRAGSGAVEDGAAFGWGEFAPVTRRE